MMIMVRAALLLAMPRTFNRKPPQLVGKYRSKFEAQIAQDLEARGVPFHYEPFKVPYNKPVRQSTYTPDYVLPNGIIVEAKGYFESADRTKHILVKAQNPHLDIRFVFQNSNNKLTKGSKTTYGDWATKNGFKYTDKHIPEEWVNEQPTAPPPSLPRKPPTA